jgi:hypothetical protein
MTMPSTRAAIEHYNDLLVREHLVSTQEHLARATEERGLRFFGRPICEVLRPYFIHARTYETLNQAAALVARGVTVLSRRLALDEVLRRALALTPEEEAILRQDPGEPTELVARIDGFIGPDGAIGFVEYNPMPAGLTTGDELRAVYASMPVMDSFARRYPLRSIPTQHMVCNALLRMHQRKGGNGRPTIAVLTTAAESTGDNNASLMNLEEMAKMFQIVLAGGFEVRITDPAQLTLREGRLFAEDFRVDSTLVADWPRFLKSVAPDAPFWQAVRSGAMWIINSAAAAILRGSKSVFALLSDPSYRSLFEPEVAAALARYIPWTRRVIQGKTAYRDQTVDLVPFIAAHRDNLVLKPADEYGGMGVVLGWECDDATWTSTLDHALRHPYVVQERVLVGSELFPIMLDGKLSMEKRYFDVDPFIWNDTDAAGCYVRLSKTGIMNLSAGQGSTTPMYLIDGGPKQ